MLKINIVGDGNKGYEVPGESTEPVSGQYEEIKDEREDRDGYLRPTDISAHTQVYEDVEGQRPPQKDNRVSVSKAISISSWSSINFDLLFFFLGVVSMVQVSHKIPRTLDLSKTWWR